MNLVSTLRQLSGKREVGAYGNTLLQQRGSTLLVALIMLVLLSLIAVSSIQSTTSSIQVVGNAQFREEAKAAAQMAIEQVMSNTGFQTTVPAPISVDVNRDNVIDYTVTFNNPAPSCVASRPVLPTDPNVPPVCASSIGAICFWTTWDISAVVNDVQTGASVTLHQGVQTIAGGASCGF